MQLRAAIFSLKLFLKRQCLDSRQVDNNILCRLSIATTEFSDICLLTAMSAVATKLMKLISTTWLSTADLTFEMT